MRNLLLNITFDGRRYHGWQIQKNAVTVQQVFQEALYRLLGSETEIKACSRTDSGVHARMFCVSLKTESGISAENFPPALNRYLPEDIAVLACREMPLQFHARYDCKGKQYRYEILNRRLRDPFRSGLALHYWRQIDETLLNTAASQMLGAHDFSSFCTLDRREKGDLVRNVTEAEVLREDDLVVFQVSADGFLYNMVRIMVGTLLRVQEGRIPADGIREIIARRDRSAAGPTAPACGLYLNRVYYGI